MSNEKILDFRQNMMERELRQYDDRGDIEAAEHFFDEWKKKLEEEHNLPLLVDMYNRQGSFYRSCGMYEESLDSFQSAVEKIEQSVGHYSSECAKIYNNIAGTYRAAGMKSEAVQYYLESLQIYEKLGESESYTCAKVHENLAQVLVQKRDWQEASSHLEQALNIIKKIPDHAHESVLLYSKWLSIRLGQGNEQKARECANEVLSSFEIWQRRKDPGFCAALCTVGGFLFRVGDYEQAKDVYIKAEAYTERHFGQDENYAAICQFLYRLYRRMGKTESAIVELTKAETAYTRIFGEDHERTYIIREELAKLIG